MSYLIIYYFISGALTKVTHYMISVVNHFVVKPDSDYSNLKKKPTWWLSQTGVSYEHDL